MRNLTETSSPVLNGLAWLVFPGAACFPCRVYLRALLLLVYLLHVAPVPDDRSVRAEPRVLEHDTLPGSNSGCRGAASERDNRD